MVKAEKIDSESKEAKKLRIDIKKLDLFFQENDMNPSWSINMMVNMIGNAFARGANRNQLKELLKQIEQIYDANLEE